MSRVNDLRIGRIREIVGEDFIPPTEQLRRIHAVLRASFEALDDDPMVAIAQPNKYVRLSEAPKPWTPAESDRVNTETAPIQCTLPPLIRGTGEESISAAAAAICRPMPPLYVHAGQNVDITVALAEGREIICIGGGGGGGSTVTLPQGASGGNGRTAPSERATAVERPGVIGGSGGGISPYEAAGTPGAGQGVAGGIALGAGGSGPSRTGAEGRIAVIGYYGTDDGSDGEQP